MTNTVECGLHKAKLVTITNDHLKLLKQMYVSWEDCEYGAPSIDCKRPYGNSSVELDIIEILGWTQFAPNNDGELSQEAVEACSTIHRETQAALQILLQTGSYDILDSYKNCSCSSYHWARRQS